MPQCSAVSKRSGEQCRRRATIGKAVCAMHGGKTPVGPALPQYQNGRYSKYLPERMLARYHEAERDAALLELRAEVSLIDGRLSDVLKRVDTGESSQIWKALRQTFGELQDARNAGDEGEESRLFGALYGLIVRGQADWAAWEDVRGLIRDRKALVESERKRLVEAQQMIAVDQAMAMMGLLVEAVRRHVVDPDAVRAVAGEFSRLTALAHPLAVEPGDGVDPVRDGGAAGHRA